MNQLHTANKVCGGCCAISLNTVDTESSVSPKSSYGDFQEFVVQPFSRVGIRGATSKMC